MELKTKIHWPLHFCNHHNCNKTVPQRERKRKRGNLSLINLRNSGNKSCAGTPLKQFFASCFFPNRVTEYGVSSTEEQHFFKKTCTKHCILHVVQLWSPCCYKLLVPFTSLLGKVTKETLLKGNLKEKDKTLPSGSSYIAT